MKGYLNVEKASINQVQIVIRNQNDLCILIKFLKAT